MKRLITALTLTSTIFLLQNCVTTSKSQETAAKQQPTPENSTPAMGNQQGNHSGMDSHNMMNHGNQTSDHNHGNSPSPMCSSGNCQNASDHSHGNQSHSATTQAKLTLPPKINPNQSVALSIDVQDLAGKPVTQFETFQDKLMHLIVVSNNLQSFQHLHPEYKGNGQFAIAATFPQGGNYTLFSDYKPVGQSEQVSVLTANVTGDSSATPNLDMGLIKDFDNTKVSLQLSPSTLKAGQEVNLIFDLQDKATRKPITNLQPYLGEKGHLVIIQQAPQLQREHYIHAHALKDTPQNQVHFMTKFPQPGNYKLWGQFNRNGEIITADFWVKVLP